MDTLLRRIDDFQTVVVLLVLLVGNILAAALCMFAHFTPWSLVALGATLSLGALSVALRGMWRMGLLWRPLVAIALFAVAFAEPAMVPKTGSPDWLGFGVGVLSAAGALWLFYMICLTDDWWPNERHEEAPEVQPTQRQHHQPSSEPGQAST